MGAHHFRWIAAYVACGWAVAISMEVAIRSRNGQEMPRYGSSDWGELCFTAAMIVAFWPFVLAGMAAYWVASRGGSVLRSPWLHPSWYAMHLPYSMVQKIRGLLSRQGDGHDEEK